MITSTFGEFIIQRTQHHSSSALNYYSGWLSHFLQVFQSGQVHDHAGLAEVVPHNVHLPPHLVPVAPSLLRAEDGIRHSRKHGSGIAVHRAGGIYHVSGGRDCLVTDHQHSA